MNYKQCLIVVLASFAAIVIADSSGLHQHDSNMGLLHFMSRSNELLQRNPQRSVECFDYYIPLINQIALEYETKFKDCLDKANTARTAAEEATLDQRKNLANSADSACKVLQKCVEIESVQEEYQCYIDGGSENAKTMYGITVEASDELAEMSEQFRVIENTENRCTNETKREYEVQSSAAYANFNDCILGISEVPTTTEAPSTEAPSTEAPSTEAPSTEAPSTEASTEEPSTGERDISVLRSVKNLKYHLQQPYRG